MPMDAVKISVKEIEKLLQQKPERHLPASDKPLKPAAVLIPIYQKNGNWSLVFTHRTHSVQDHKGQVSFPGGAIEPQDGGPVSAALREAHEEIGLEPADVVVLGSLGELATSTHYLVTPVVGKIPWPYRFKVSPVEVEKVFSIPLSWLADSSHWIEEVKEHHGSKSHVIIYQPYKGENLWGVTAQITLNFLKILHLLSAS